MEGQGKKYTAEGRGNRERKYATESWLGAQARASPYIDLGNCWDCIAPWQRRDGGAVCFVLWAGVEMEIGSRRRSPCRVEETAPRAQLFDG